MTKFSIALWHPFGPHGGETPEQIINRKRGEIAINGWTLWTFQYRRPEVLEAWHRELSANSPLPRFAFCSDSGLAKDPDDGDARVRTVDCRSYRMISERDWLSIPPDVRAPHPFRPGKTLASAFVVQRITCQVKEFGHPALQWLFSDGRWRTDMVPTRGEYLIRPGGTEPMRRVRAVLELRAPYLAQVSADEAANHSNHR